ncbi:hypothetical protein DAPPUDRAFT_233987 [Daphnia pulex]|uniref:Uncharacterized protein n=1 Tax=Daphnia pulex TaxID=6669 RepID=E9FUA0_DAPPU|nr:hypothetical protein DAPPUDRAFT_233987 [Daphnia pulex]|eukprot:EFX88958.1 hypothetical protein DAPPUDRAFT_233987 [Daphnia pulex]
MELQSFPLKSLQHADKSRESCTTTATTTTPPPHLHSLIRRLVRLVLFLSIPQLLFLTSSYAVVESRRTSSGTEREKSIARTNKAETTPIIYKWNTIEL